MRNTGILMEPSPFSKKTLRIARDWYFGSVVTGPHAFKPITRLTSFWKKAAGATFPPLSGHSNPAWMQDARGNIVVLKKSSPLETANEKIAADFAYRFGLPVAPVRLWEKSGSFMSASLRPFTNSTEAPHETLMLRDRFLPGIAIFDLWIRNYDRHPGSLVYDPSHGSIAYVDHGRSMLNEGYAAFTNLNENFLGEHWALPRNVDQAIIPNLETSLVAIKMIEAIEHTSDQVIGLVLGAIPEAILTAKEKRETADGLKLRRDHLRPLLLKSTLAP